ncbi:MAG TPA: thiamine phosphate synthase [Terriglobales bacterium]|nr:thiamine phosphate synthase [Terriglobales bacterium]
MLLYYITDRSQFDGDEAARRSRLLVTIAESARCGVDYVQLREKDLSARELETLAREVQLRTENQKLRTVFLINSRTDIAWACGGQGVHLPANDISPSEVRKIWSAPGRLTIGASCHTRTEVARARQEGADFAVFGPVFEKAGARPAGLDALREACQEKIPVLALGGVTLENAESCMQAGAAGIAAIRLFQDTEMDGVVAALREIGRRRPGFRPQPVQG